MEKSQLEKRIEQKASEKFNKDYDVFQEFMQSNNIAKRLYLNISETEDLPLYDFGQNSGLFNGECDRNKNANKTNLKEVKEEIISEYIKTETEALLNKVAALKDFFEMAQ